MLEIIKAIIDPIAKSLSLPALLEARKNRKAHELGTELFLLYASLNDVLVLGRDIVAELERVCARMEQKFREGKPNEGCSSRLEFLLRQQSLSILKLVGPSGFVRGARGNARPYRDCSRRAEYASHASDPGPLAGSKPRD
jgi:hypothetical protein